MHSRRVSGQTILENSEEGSAPVMNCQDEIYDIFSSMRKSFIIHLLPFRPIGGLGYVETGERRPESEERRPESGAPLVEVAFRPEAGRGLVVLSRRLRAADELSR